MEIEFAHVLVLPFPIIGHLNPMIQFAKRLVSKGLQVTLLTTSSTHHLLTQSQSQSQTPISINIQQLFDGFPHGKSPEATDLYFNQFKTTVSQSLSDFIDYKLTKSPFYIVYDSFLPWVLPLAHRFGFDCAPFFTQSCAVAEIYNGFDKGNLKELIARNGDEIRLPGLPILKGSDLPSFIHYPESHPVLLKTLIGQFSNAGEADCVLFNSFDELENEVVKSMARKWRVKNIGPAVPSMFLDKRLDDNKDYGLSLFNPNAEVCMKWLDSKEPGSVVFASFGSLAALGEDQMKEIALGLKLSGSFFLWVVRDSEMKKLPSNYKEEMLEKALIVSWSPQLEVLAHVSVGCFISHCGWNSTLEAISIGVPIVAMPQFTDQPTNAKFIEDVWKIGIRVNSNDEGIITKEEIERCVKVIMEDEKGKEIRDNSAKWKVLARESVNEGGSSDKNIDALVAKLTCKP